MTSNIPANLTYGTVTGRFLLAYSDGNDTGSELDFTAAKGTVLFTPSAPYIVNPEFDLTFMPATIECTLDSEGHLLGPDLTRGVRLLATNIAGNNPSGWTWRVDFRLTDQTDTPTRGISSFSFELPVGQTIDLTQATPVPAGNGVYYSANGPKGDTGAAGQSAYQLAVTKGFTGTEAQWVESLKGRSAYQIAVGDGFVGTEQEWLDSLVGPQGAQGVQGPQGNSFGDSAYVVATQNGFIGTEEEWLASLVGPTGATGATGPEGPAGETGPEGLTAYQIYARVYTDFNIPVPLTESQWLASLKGEKGDTGKSAYERYVEIMEATSQVPLSEYEWSLPAADGADGKSAYELASQYASYASEAAWVASLKGETGPQGPMPFNLITSAYNMYTVYKVKDAITYYGSIYVCVKEHSNVAPTTSNPPGGPYWILALERGPQGAQGIPGATGQKGDKGDTGAASTVQGPAGKSAYESWVESYNGLPRPYASEQAWVIYGLTNDYTYAKEYKDFTGTRDEWLATLIGPAGPAGASGGNGETANFILNGGLDVWQRGTSFSIGANASAFTADRWKVSGTLVKTVSYTTKTTDYTSPNRMRIQANPSTVGKNLQLETTIEASEAAILVGEKVVFSFDVSQSGGDYSDFDIYYAVPASGKDDWTTVTPVVFGSFAGGSNGNGLQEFSFDVPANAKNGLKLIIKTTYATTSEQVDLTIGKFMLEVSEYDSTTEQWSGASAFRRREKSIASEVAGCQRYFTRISKTAVDVSYGSGFQTSSTAGSVAITMPTTMRTAPTVSGVGLKWQNKLGTVAVTGVTAKAGGDGSIIELLPIWATYGLTFDSGILRSSATTSYIDFTAEI